VPASMRKKEPSVKPPHYQNLEVRSGESAFEELKQSWWWLDAAKRRAHEENPVAWQWELLRRTRAYTTFFGRSMAYVAGTNPNPCAPVGPLTDEDPCRRWASLFVAKCAPCLDWAALPIHMRNVIECNAPLYARADVLCRFTSELVIEAVIVRRQENGEEKLESAQKDGYVFPLAEPDPRASTNAAILGKHEATQILAAEAGSGAYVVVIFDVRLGRVVAKQLSNAKNGARLKICLRDLRARLEGDSNWSHVRTRKSHARICPSVQLNYAQAWIPADQVTEPQEIQARLTSLLDSPSRHKWLPECLRLWDSDTFESKKFERFPAQLRAKPARAIYNDPSFWAGFCAWDCKRIERRFARQGFLVPFLSQQPQFDRFAAPSKLADSLSRVSRLIDEIDRFYPPASHSS
jgi:hypothetical protein